HITLGYTFDSVNSLRHSSGTPSPNNRTPPLQYACNAVAPDVGCCSGTHVSGPLDGRRLPAHCPWMGILLEAGRKRSSDVPSPCANRPARCHGVGRDRRL